MPTIRDLTTLAGKYQANASDSWRDRMLPAHFDGRPFHVETGAMDSGQRVVVHQFPKKDLPWSEVMGRRAKEFNVRGYMIVYPHDPGNNDLTLYRRNYQQARDALQDRLDNGTPGVLQLPTYQPMRVVCVRYRMTEEEKYGGYVVFDMSFVERGIQPFKPQTDTAENLRAQSDALFQQVQSVWAAQTAKTGLEGDRKGMWNAFKGPPSQPVLHNMWNAFLGPKSSPVYHRFWSAFTGPKSPPSGPGP